MVSKNRGKVERQNQKKTLHTWSSPVRAESSNKTLTSELQKSILKTLHAWSSPVRDKSSNKTLTSELQKSILKTLASELKKEYLKVRRTSTSAKSAVID